MAHSSYTYTVWATDSTSLDEKDTAGYPVGKISTDGNLVIAHNQCTSEPTQTTVPTKPSYVTESMPNWPYLSLTEANQLVSYMATTIGASDGFSHNKTTPDS